MLIARHNERGNAEDLTKAVECLELVHRALPDTFDVLRVFLSLSPPPCIAHPNVCYIIVTGCYLCVTWSICPR
jgi:hypothetical protein